MKSLLRRVSENSRQYPTALCTRLLLYPAGLVLRTKTQLRGFLTERKITIICKEDTELSAAARGKEVNAAAKKNIPTPRIYSL